MKTCSKCGEAKESAEFGKDRTKPDGLYSSCTKCNYERKLGHSIKGNAKSKAQRLPRVEAAKAILIGPIRQCSKCGLVKDKSEFHKRSSSITGVVAHCKSCIKTKAAKHYLANKERHQAVHRVWRDKPEVKVHARELRKTRYKANRNHHAAKRRALLKAASPSWLTRVDWEEIESFYIQAYRLNRVSKIKYEVDHIEPLVGKTSCGLHIPNNLQVIPALINRSKGNKLLTNLN